MVTEQFIQDALCWPERIQRVLRDSGREGWEFFDVPSVDPFGAADVVNQEVSFDQGRVDIFATFNHRTRLAIIEVKAGIVGLEAVKQLNWYLENWRKMNCDFLHLRVAEPDVVGIVLAEGFVGIPDLPPNVLLVEFKFNGDAWPFRIVDPEETLSTDVTDAPSPDAGKFSQLYSFSDHRDYINKSPTLRDAFERISLFLTDADDKRRDWILRNVKGSHIAVHYKGEYLIHLWAKRQYFVSVR